MATTLTLAAGRVPPHDLDAEMSILGSILLDPLSIAKVLQFLHPEDFYRENNGQIFRAALDLFAAGEPIDNVTLASQLQTMGLLDRVGGRAQLASMQSAVPTAANIEYYGRIVKEKAYKRRLISAGGNIAGFGYDDSVEAEDAINQAQSLVFGVADDRDQRELARLYDLLGPAMERISILMESGQGVVGIPSGFHDLDRMTGGFTDSDKIAVPRRTDCFGHDSQLDSGQVRLIAYFIAEGGLSTRSPGFTNAEPEIVGDFNAQIARFFPSLQIRRHGISYFPAGKHNHRNPLTQWLHELQLMGKKAEHKRFPECVWRWDRERLREFVKVLMSCDGTIYSMAGYPRIEFAVASEGLAQDLHHALVRFGIVSKLWKKKDRCWWVEITEPASVDRYQRDIGWIGEKALRFERFDEPRRSNLRMLPKQIWREIQSAARAGGLTMTELAFRAGERGAGDRGFNPHVSRGLSPGRLGNYADVLRDRRLSQLASDQIYWDEIVSIESTGEHHVYDLTVPEP